MSKRPAASTPSEQGTADGGAVIKPSKSVAAHRYPTWGEFKLNLGLVLGRLATDNFLVISTRQDGEASTYFVQFAQGGLSGFLAEAVSNNYLTGTRALSPAQEQQMAVLGWMWPTPGSKTDLNFNRQWPMPAPFADIADLAVRTLREVFGVERPDDLVYKTFAKGGREYAQPALGIDAEPSQSSGAQMPAAPTLAELKPLVESAVRGVIGSEEVKYDEQGDIPIRMGSAAVFVRLIDGAPPLVGVFSPILWGISVSADLLSAINEANTRVRFGRLFWTGQEVMAAMEVSAIGVVPQDIAFACFQIGAIADHFDDDLQARFGGRTLAGGPVEKSEVEPQRRPIGFRPQP